MVNGNDLIHCDNSDGARAYFVARDKIFPRPSVYGLISHAARLLLVRLPNGKYVLPGGGVDRGERLEEALAFNIPEAIENETPRWVAADCLKPSHFYIQAHAEIAFDYLRHQQLTK